MARYSLVIILSMVFTLVQSQLQAVNGKIKISVGTASGCGDTVNFITNQLAETYEEYKDFLDVEFVPWGRTRYEENGEMWCQFGVNDCWANRHHRCALDRLSGNEQAQVDFMKCEFSTPHPSFLLRSYQCSAAAGLNLVDIDVCVTTSAGDHLDAAAQAAAQAPMEVINFVPSITFNDVPNLALHTVARTRLKSMVCFALAEVPDSGVTNCPI